MYGSILKKPLHTISTSSGLMFLMRMLPNILRSLRCLDRKRLKSLTAEHNKAPHERLLQKKLAEEVTDNWFIPGRSYDSAVEASQILFGKGTTESLKKMNERPSFQFLKEFRSFDVSKICCRMVFPLLISAQNNLPFLSSKGELRSLVQGGGLSMNKKKD